MPAYPTQDLALAYDGARFVADLVLEDGDLVLDDTPATPMLVSLASDRRAEADDVLPTGVSLVNLPAAWSERRGWAGDALDRAGRRIGSRLWLLDREHATEEVRRRAEVYAAEALAWLTTDYGVTPEIEVSWERLDTPSPVLVVLARVDGRSLTLKRRLAA